MSAIKNQILFLGLTLGMLLLSSCYSFKGTSISPEVNTFYVALFENNAINVVPTLDVVFTERLRDKIRLESRLRYNDTEPDIEFSGAIIGYDISSVAPQPGETTAFSRLKITVSVNYLNNKVEDDKWKQNFDFFADFSADENIINIQDDLIATINNQLVENIFNKAFNNW